MIIKRKREFTIMGDPVAKGRHRSAIRKKKDDRIDEIEQLRQGIIPEVQTEMFDGEESEADDVADDGPVQEEMSQHFADGQHAFTNSISYQDCEYEDGSQEASDWKDGWMFEAGEKMENDKVSEVNPMDDNDIYDKVMGQLGYKKTKSQALTLGSLACSVYGSKTNALKTNCLPIIDWLLDKGCIEAHDDNADKEDKLTHKYYVVMDQQDLIKAMS